MASAFCSGVRTLADKLQTPFAHGVVRFLTFEIRTPAGLTDMAHLVIFRVLGVQLGLTLFQSLCAQETFGTQMRKRLMPLDSRPLL